MKYPSLLFLLVVFAATAGCYLAAIPRYDEIARPVTSADLVGKWRLSAESLRSMAIDGHTPKAGEEYSITLRSDGSCSYQTVLSGSAYLKRDGRWTIRYAASEHFKNLLDFHLEDMVISGMKVAMDSTRMVLWVPWGDPDAGVDLVYHKK